MIAVCTHTPLLLLFLPSFVCVVALVLDDSFSRVVFISLLLFVQGKVFTEEEDAFLLNMMHRYGYGNWEVIRMEIRKVYIRHYLEA